MVVVATACLVGLAAVVVALLRDEPIVDRLRPPDWGPLPAPVDVARVEFPLAFPGYDPASVEMTFEALNEAYADLLAVAPPAVVERARRRAALRAGADLAAAPDGGPEARLPEAAAAPRHDCEALRAEAALAAVAAPERREARV